MATAECMLRDLHKATETCRMTQKGHCGSDALVKLIQNLTVNSEQTYFSGLIFSPT
jgi:hypothetical protein